MGLYVYSSDEGSEERNAWSVLLRRDGWRRASEMAGQWITVSLVVLANVFIWLPDNRMAGVMFWVVLAALLLSVSVSVGRALERLMKSKLLPATDSTPLNSADIAAALEMRFRIQIIPVILMTGLTMVNSLLRLAIHFNGLIYAKSEETWILQVRLRDQTIETITGLHFLYTPLLLCPAGALLLASTIYLACGFFVKHRLYTQSLFTREWHERFMARVLVVGAAVLAIGVVVGGMLTPLTVVLLGEMDQAVLGMGSVPSNMPHSAPEIFEPALLSACYALFSVGFWVLGRVFWKSAASVSFEDVRQGTENQRSRKWKIL